MFQERNEKSYCLIDRYVHLIALMACTFLGSGFLQSGSRGYVHTFIIS